jgi:hypothetical protein
MYIIKNYIVSLTQRKPVEKKNYSTWMSEKKREMKRKKSEEKVKQHKMKWRKKKNFRL